MKDATSLLLLPGLAGAGSEFSAQQHRFRGTRRVVALDPFVAGDLSIEGQAAQVVAVARKHGLARYVVVGHSQGGIVALGTARLHPDGLAGIVVLDAPVLLPRVVRTLIRIPLGLFATPVARPLLRSFFKGTFTASDPELWRRSVLERLERVPTSMARAVVKGAFTYDTRAALDSLDQPALVIRANIPIKLDQLPPGVRGAEVLDAGHWAHVHAPELVNDLLESFLFDIDIDIDIGASSEDAQR